MNEPKPSATETRAARSSSVPSASTSPATSQAPKIGLCAAIALVAGLALGLIIGVTVEKPSANAADATGLSASAAPAAVYIWLQNSTFEWNGRAYQRKSMNASGAAIETINGVPTYVIPSAASKFHVFYRNRLSEETMIHAHGLTPPWTFDGVPFLSAAPLAPGDEQLYSFALFEHNGGTSFLHAHYDVHHGQGLAMPFLVRQPTPSDYPEAVAHAIAAAHDVVLMLNEFCPFYAGGFEDIAVAAAAAATVDPDCRDQPVMYAVEEDMQRRAAAANATADSDSTCLAPTERLVVRWRAQMANGRLWSDPATAVVSDGVEYVRLRIINAASQSNYLLDFGGLSATIIAADGRFVKPLAAETVRGGVWIGVSQRLDVLLHVPLTALGVGSSVAITAREESSDYSLLSGVLLQRGASTQSAATAAQGSGLAMNTTAAGWWNQMALEATLSAFTPLPEPGRAPDRSFTVELSGFHGTLNGRTYREYPAVPFRRNPSPLRVRYGERIHITLVNRTPEPHAMHVHGHSFQVLEVDGHAIAGGGAIRDTVMLPAGCHNTTIAFDALNPGIHEFHCHMAYDMMAGMITTIEYTPSAGGYDPPPSSTPPPAHGGH